MSPNSSAPYRGAGLLRSFIVARGLTIRAVADALGITATPIIGWLHHGERPRRDIQEALARWTTEEVPEASWLRDGELRPVDRVRPYEPPEEQDGPQLAAADLP